MVRGQVHDEIPPDCRYHPPAQELLSICLERVAMRLTSVGADPRSGCPPSGREAATIGGGCPTEWHAIILQIALKVFRLAGWGSSHRLRWKVPAEVLGLIALDCQQRGFGFRVDGHHRFGRDPQLRTGA